MIRSAADVRAFWSIFSKVPSRLNRDHRDEELFCLALYLRAMLGERLLKYPLSIKAAGASRSPDFMLTHPSGKTTGIEVTRATIPDVQRMMTESEKRFERTGKPVASVLFERGWAGLEAEEQWCRLVNQAIEKKARKLSGFERATSYELLIYDDTPLPTVDRKIVVPEMQKLLRGRSHNGARSFDKVSVIISLDVLYDLGGEPCVIAFVKPPSPTRNDPNAFSKIARKLEKAAALVAGAEIAFRLLPNGDVYSMDEAGRLIKDTTDGRRVEVRIENDGAETIAGEIKAS